METVPKRILRMYHRVLTEPQDVDAVAHLADALAHTGSVLRTESVCADIASTGGPSSLSTLLCPLYLVGAGFVVRKIGGPGRPAGGIDVLGTLRGYRTTLSADEVNKGIAEAGYVQVLAGETWAPADAALFRFRQQQGTQAIPALAVASLLAKKLAAGVGVAGLEARIAPHGNFGASAEEGRRSALLYCKVAELLGLTGVVVLTDARVPFQPYIGRGEALEALWKVVGDDLDDDSWLAEHAELCSLLANVVANQAGSRTTDGRSAGPQPLQVLTAHLEAQGSSIAELLRRVNETLAQERRTLPADDDGYVRFDSDRIRATIGALAAEDKSGDVEYQFADPAGVRLMCQPGQRVRRGEPVIELRSSFGWPEQMTAGLFSTTASPGPKANTIMEVVYL